MLDDTLKILSRKREKCDVIFSTLYEEICSLADILDVKIKIPRLTKTQRNREHYLCDTAVDYFRRSIYILINENVIEDLKSRYLEETLNLFHLFILFPNLSNDQNCIKTSIHSLSE